MLVTVETQFKNGFIEVKSLTQYDMVYYMGCTYRFRLDWLSICLKFHAICLYVSILTGFSNLDI